MRHHFGFPLAVLVLSTFTCFGASDPPAAQAEKGPEDFRIELTGSAWLVGPTGIIQADGTPINFVSDLAVGSQQPHFYGRLVLKPGRKHRIVIEGSPVSFSGSNTIQSSFVFRDHTYDVSQTVATNANVNYAFAAYQYDPLSGRFGHLGFQVGAAYLGVQGTLDGIQSGISETKSFQAGVPLVGTEFRLFPIPRHKIVQIEGMFRGMSVGSYGYFVEGGASAGLRFGPVSLLAGYREMFANVHQSGDLSEGVALHLKGPIFSLQWQY
jgi:hypothetical protein